MKNSAIRGNLVQQRGALLGRRPRQRRQIGTWSVLSHGWWRMAASSIIAAQHAVALSYFCNRYRIYRMPVRWRRNTRSGASCHTMAHPDYGDAGIYREGHRASSKAKPRRDATSVPRSCERLICRCRGQIGPESDGRLRRAHDRIRQAATLASPGMVLLCLLLRDSPTSISRVRGPNRRPLARQKHLGEPR